MSENNNQDLNEGFEVEMDDANVITVPIDATLSNSNEAADAKAVGDALALKADKSELQAAVKVNNQPADDQGLILIDGRHIPVSDQDTETLASAVTNLKGQTAADIPMSSDAGAKTIKEVVDENTQAIEGMEEMTGATMPIESGSQTTVKAAIEARVKTVNRKAPDADGDVDLSVVPLAENLQSDKMESVEGSFIMRTTGGNASVSDGKAYPLHLFGTAEHTGYVAEELNMTVIPITRTEPDEPITATIDRDTFVAYVDESGTTNLYYTTEWSADPELYGITVTGTPVAGDQITVVYVKEVRGTITVADPERLVGTGWNLFDYNNGYARVVKYSNEYGYKVGGSYVSLQFSATLTGERSNITPGADGLFNVSDDGYVFVNGGNNTDTYILATWSDWMDGPSSGYWEPYRESGIDLSAVMTTYFPNGLLAVGTIRDEIDLSAKRAISRVERMAYSEENRAAAAATERPYDFDENYIYLARETSVVNAITIDTFYNVSEHGLEWFTETTQPVITEILYGKNLRDKLERDVLTISAQVLNAEEKAQVRQNIGVMDPPTNGNGTNGQLLQTNGDGTTKWTTQGTPTDAQVGTAVSAWLTAHPEATTTVQDGAISRAKLNDDLKAKTDEVPEIEIALSDRTKILGVDLCKRIYGKSQGNTDWGFVEITTVVGKNYSLYIDKSHWSVETRQSTDILRLNKTNGTTSTRVFNYSGTQFADVPTEYNFTADVTTYNLYMRGDAGSYGEFTIICHDDIAPKKTIELVNSADKNNMIYNSKSRENILDWIINVSNNVIFDGGTRTFIQSSNTISTTSVVSFPFNGRIFMLYGHKCRKYKMKSFDYQLGVDSDSGYVESMDISKDTPYILRFRKADSSSISPSDLLSLCSFEIDGQYAETETHHALPITGIAFVDQSLQEVNNCVTMQNADAFPTNPTRIFTFHCPMPFNMRIVTYDQYHLVLDDSGWLVDGDTYSFSQNAGSYKVMIRLKTVGAFSDTLATIKEYVGKGYFQIGYEEYRPNAIDSNVHNNWVYAARFGQERSRSNNIPLPCAVHVTDIHGDYTRLKRAYEYAEYIGANYVINTGDTVNTQPSKDKPVFAEEVDSMFDIPTLTVIGNHDAVGIRNLTDLYNANIKYYADRWNYTCGDHCEYYYDDSTNKIRFICINQFDGNADTPRISEEQMVFIVNAMKATPTDYGVIILGHEPWVQCSKITKYSDDWWDEDYTEYCFPMVPRLVDLFQSKTTGTITWEQYAINSQNVETISVNVDFTSLNNNVEFIGFICGHEHSDFIGYITDSTNKQVIMIETCTRANFGMLPNLVVTNSSLLPRDYNGAVQDAFNVYGFDKTKQNIKIAKIGSTRTVTGVERNFLKIPYVEQGS